MTKLVWSEPFFEDLFDFRRDFDKIFSRLLTEKPWDKEVASRKVYSFVPAVEAYVDKEMKKYVCKVSLPGIDPKEVQIHVQGELLTITGERKFTREIKEPEFLHEEFAYGRFERILELPEGVNTEKITADFVNGVLEINAPVSAVALPRKIEIKVTPYVKQIAA